MEERLNSKTVKQTVFVAMGVLSLLLQEALARVGPEAAIAWLASNPHLAIINLALIFGIMSLFVYLFDLRTFVLSHHRGTEDTEKNQ